VVVVVQSNLVVQEEALWALCEQANTMNPPDAMALVYDKSPDVTPKMDDIPQVSQINDKHLAKVTAEMQSLFEVTDATYLICVQTCYV
jgi:hypothetical protein